VERVAALHHDERADRDGQHGQGGQAAAEADQDGEAGDQLAPGDEQQGDHLPADRRAQPRDAGGEMMPRTTIPARRERGCSVIGKAHARLLF